MINQYHEVHNNEEDQAIIQGINPDHFPYYCLLFVTALSTFLGGLLLYDLLDNQNYESDCKVIVVSLQYYSQFLMMDGLAQIIIWFIMMFVLSYIRNYDIEKGLKKQLFFQLIDTGIFIIIITFIQAGVKEKKHCVSLEGRFTIILYTILIYILFFMLLLAKVD